MAFLVPISPPLRLLSPSCRLLPPCFRPLVCTAAPDRPPASAPGASSPSGASFNSWTSALGIAATAVAPEFFSPPASADPAEPSPSLRGLVATQPIPADTALLTVPRAAALQVTSLDGASAPVPPGVGLPPTTWRELPWYAKLALQLHVARVDTTAPLHPWAADLPPTPPDVLHRWSPAALAQLQDDRLVRRVNQQRKLYADICRTIAQQWSTADEKAVKCPTAEQLTWALDMVRSRSFAGPLESAPFRERASLAAFIAVNTIVWPTLHVLPLQNAINGGLTALFALAMYDILLPRILQFTQGLSLRRYALTPAIDYLNHSSTVSTRGQVSFRYFTDKFEVRSDRAYGTGEQVFISYGAQGSDSLLQYYGFLPDDQRNDDDDAGKNIDNSNETWTFDDNVANMLGVTKGPLVVSGVSGFDRETITAVRARVGGSERKAKAALLAACKAQLQRFPTTVEQDDEIARIAKHDGQGRLCLAARYRSKKKCVLQKTIDMFEKSAE